MPEPSAVRRRVLVGPAQPRLREDDPADVELALEDLVDQFDIGEEAPEREQRGIGADPAAQTAAWTVLWKVVTDYPDEAHAADAVEHVGEHLAALVADVKPRLRGWLHAVTSPLALVAGVA